MGAARDQRCVNFGLYPGKIRQVIIDERHRPQLVNSLSLGTLGALRIAGGQYLLNRKSVSAQILEPCGSKNVFKRGHADNLMTAVMQLITGLNGSGNRLDA